MIVRYFQTLKIFMLCLTMYFFLLSAMFSARIYAQDVRDVKSTLFIEANLAYKEAQKENALFVFQID